MNTQFFKLSCFCLVILLSCTAQRHLGSKKVEGLEIGPVITIHSESGFRAPCEPSISIDPTNPGNVVAGSVLDNVYFSQDGGASWTLRKLTSSYGVYGDPVIRHTSNGSVLYAHLSNPDGKAYHSDSFLDRIVVQKSEDKGHSWSNGSFPLCDLKKDQDKQWLCSGKENVVLMSWTEFDKYGDSSALCKSRILFSKSLDGGTTWSAALDISDGKGDCIDDDKTAEGAYPCIGADNTYYVVWGRDNAIWLNKSLDKGNTWLQKEKMVGVQYGGWAMNIPGIGRCNGMPVLKCDLSGGPNHGRLYILWADQRNGADNTDVWLCHSDTQGESWSAPIKVNDDNVDRHQFFPWMDVDQKTGKIYVVFYDRRNSKGTKTDVFLAWSDNGGSTFKNVKISSSPFESKEVGFFGDYNDISAFGGNIRPIWTRQDGDKLSIQTAIIQDETGK